MSAYEMTTQQPEIVEEVHLDDPALEEELFGELTDAVRAEILSFVDESDTTTTSSPASFASPFTRSPSSRTTATTPDLDDEALTAEIARRCFAQGAVTGTTKVETLVKSSIQLSREEERRLKNEKRAMALEKKEAAEKKSKMKRKRGDDDGAGEQVVKRELTDAAVEEMKKLDTIVESEGAQQGEGEDVQAPAKMEETELPSATTVHESTNATAAGIKHPAPTATSNGAQKRRGEDDNVEEERVAECEVTDATVAEMKQPPPVPISNVVQKGKRGGDDEAEGRPTKRGLTDGVAAEIAQRDEHSFSEDLKEVEKRRDSVTETDAQGATVNGAESVKQSGEAEEQHLAPPISERKGTVTVDPLAILDDDDEMTRMLKEELAKPDIFEVYTDEEAEPEDPCIVAILSPLTEHEKGKVVDAIKKNVTNGKAATTTRTLEKAVEMTINRREITAKKNAAGAARTGNAPKKTSPLANDGVAAEEQEIEGRAELAPKTRKVAPKVTEVDVVPPTTTESPDDTPSDDGELVLEEPCTAPPPPPSPAANTASPQAMAIGYTTLTLPELKNTCKERSLIVTGDEKDILDRLVAYDADVAMGRVPKGLKAVPKKKAHVYLWDKKVKRGGKR